MTEGDVVRCFGGPDDPLMARYHDEEWGVPVHDDAKLFEFLVLEGFQAGLSWRTILHKRENFRRALDGFDATKIASYGPAERERLMGDAGIVRNRLKIEAVVTNAQAFLDTQAEFGSFDRYIWAFTGGKTLRRPGVITFDAIPPTSPESDAMAKDLKARGFRFVGSTVCYAHMEATGMVNDHITACFRAPRLA
ncbi:MAG: DNA-3-methyladenine glycosylase I [Planctomycetes bacterium]|nr:DNA-3-methyladenine glycosylase I [Planctomycetota bacterium]